MIHINDISALDPNGNYNYADYLTWKFEQAVEVIKGKIMKMSAPNRKHQEISWQLGGCFYIAFKGTSCKAYAAPFDVRLLTKPKNSISNIDVTTVVQPDLCVICDSQKLDEKGCIGAPDLIVEILSPGNSKKEMRTKKELYEENLVREYWIIDPIHETLVRYFLDEKNQYAHPQFFVSDDIVQSHIFPSLKINLSEIFEEETNIQ